MPIIKRLVPIIFIAAAMVVAGVTFLAPDRVGAATPRIGCPPETLTVRTGQRFYHTIVVSDVADLYAWQTDLTYSETYLAYEGFVVGDFLRRDGAAQYTIAPTTATERIIKDLAVTRLSRHTGQDGSGPVAYIFFTALRSTGTGRTAAKVSSALLVDRNAIEISKSYIDHGNCWTIIQDDAPVLVQPPVGPRIYLPLVLRRSA